LGLAAVFIDLRGFGFGGGAADCRVTMTGLGMKFGVSDCATSTGTFCGK
jgi:hypothetical protein